MARLSHLIACLAFLGISLPASAVTMVPLWHDGTGLIVHGPDGFQKIRPDVFTEPVFRGSPSGLTWVERGVSAQIGKAAPVAISESAPLTTAAIAQGALKLVRGAGAIGLASIVLPELFDAAKLLYEDSQFKSLVPPPNVEPVQVGSSSVYLDTYCTRAPDYAQIYTYSTPIGVVSYVKLYEDQPPAPPSFSLVNNCGYKVVGGTPVPSHLYQYKHPTDDCQSGMYFDGYSCSTGVKTPVTDLAAADLLTPHIPSGDDQLQLAKDIDRAGVDVQPGPWRATGPVSLQQPGGPAPYTGGPMDGTSDGSALGPIIIQGGPFPAPWDPAGSSQIVTLDGGTSESNTVTDAGTTTQLTQTYYDLHFDGDTINVVRRTTSTTTDPAGHSITINTEDRPSPLLSPSGGGAPPSDGAPTDQQPADPIDLCIEHPDASGCAALGSDEDPPDLQDRQVQVGLSPEMSSAGACPADKQLSILGRTYALSWSPVCQFATGIRPVVLAVGWLGAGLLLFGFARST